MDFVHDQLATGQKIRVLTVVDTAFSRFSPVIDPRFSYRAEDVVATLERICAATGFPKTIRVDQGPESSPGPRSLGLCEGRHAGLLKARQTYRQRLHRGIQRSLPGGVFNTHCSSTLADAREKLEDWRNYYNEDRPHGAIGNKPPASLVTLPAYPARRRDQRPENSTFRRSNDG